MLDRPNGTVKSFIHAEDGRFIFGTSDGMIKILDFHASRKRIFQELADKFAKMDEYDIPERMMVMARFLKMPKKERAEIYGELYQMLKPFPNDSIECGEFAFHDQRGLRSTDQQKAQAITNYLNKLPNGLEKTPASPVAEIVQTSDEALQYVRDILNFVSESELKQTGLESIDDLQAIGISPQHIEIFQQIQKELIKLSQADEQAALVASLQTDPYKASEAIVLVKYFIDTVLVNFSSLGELVKEMSIFQSSIPQPSYNDLLVMQNTLNKIMENVPACAHLINSGILFTFAKWFLKECAQLESNIKGLQYKLFEAYLSQPHLNAAWKNLRKHDITHTSQLAQHVTSSRLYRLADTLPAPSGH